MEYIRIGSRKDKLYKKDLYLMKDVNYIISQKITEYDMKNAGINLIKYYKLLPEDKINELTKMTKMDMNIQIGKLMRADPGFNRSLTKAFGMMRKKFFDKNSLGKTDILSIKKDAIFVIGKPCKFTKFGNVEFVEKNKYTSFHKFGNIEMYYQYSTDKLDIKGIRDDNLIDHEEYFLAVLRKLFRLVESQNKSALIKFIQRFVTAYKERDMDIHYYRELNGDSSFILNKTNNVSDFYTIGFTEADQSMVDKIDISYNYMNYILPIMQRFYFI